MFILEYMLFVDNKQYVFPDTLGKTIEKGKECMHAIRADYVGNLLHVQYIRPCKIVMPDHDENLFPR